MLEPLLLLLYIRIYSQGLNTFTTLQTPAQQPIRPPTAHAQGHG